ncbi:unnamed protein product, partial [Clonostachys solani]
MWNSLISTVQSLGVSCPLADRCHDEAVYNSAEDLADHIRHAHYPGAVLPSFRQFSQSLSSLTLSLSGPSPTSVRANHSSPLPPWNRDGALPEHSSPLVQHHPIPTAQSPLVLVQPNLNPTAQSPQPLAHYSQGRTVQVREQAQPRTQYGDPRLTAVQEQAQREMTDIEKDVGMALLALGRLHPGAGESTAAQGGNPVLQAQPLAGTAPGGQAHDGNMHESAPHGEEQTQPEEEEDAPEAASQSSGPTTVPDPPFVPNPGDKCSMCLRSLPLEHIKPPKNAQPSFEAQWRAHENPEGNCGIPNKRGSNKNLPDRSGWIERSKYAVAEARKAYRDPFEELFPNKFYPVHGGPKNSSYWEYDPNNESNRENWNKPWPPPVEKKLGEDAAPDPDDGIEPDPDETRPRKRRRAGDSTYRPAPQSDVDEGDEDAESAAPEDAPARGRTRAQGRRRARASGPRGAAGGRRGRRGSRTTSAAAAEPAPPPEAPRRSARQRARRQ